ncbi:GntR family transcriptional regulator [Micromonospora sp. KC606]|uniref:GntR family transcriptional regulator n=1 Tax=Micromonospora sp. KC606 TaxID=2530379 RepID=UPI001046E2E0|nr:GntR family transcriptional regulator [Micromonospora sp. KC606]TDC73539.1 GntR family transcriptional regulator [Micromonospora sp. KC606]
MTGDLGAKAPKYQRIADELRREIKEGVYRPGERLPAESMLLERFRAGFPGLSLQTLRNAIGVLRGEGLVEARHGVGTFVNQSRPLQRRSRFRYGRAREDHQLLTSHLRHEITDVEHTSPPERIALLAALEPDVEMLVRRRILFDKETGKPQELGASYLPLSFAEGTLLEAPEVVPKALFLCVEDLSGKRYARAQDHWRWRMPSSAEAEALQMSPSRAVLHLVHVARAADGTLLEVSESVWPADSIEIIDEYELPASPEGRRGLSDV